MDKKLTTQQTVVLDYLMKGRTLTNKVALSCLGVGSLSSRISELRKLGYKIAVQNEEDKLTGNTFRKYNMDAVKLPAEAEERIDA